MTIRVQLGGTDIDCCRTQHSGNLSALSQTVPNWSFGARDDLPRRPSATLHDNESFSLGTACASHRRPASSKAAVTGNAMGRREAGPTHSAQG